MLQNSIGSANKTNLAKLKSIFANMDIRNILSIGCINSLFEWIIKESIGAFNLSRNYIGIMKLLKVLQFMARK